MLDTLEEQRQGATGKAIEVGLVKNTVSVVNQQVQGDLFNA